MPLPSPSPPQAPLPLAPLPLAPLPRAVVFDLDGTLIDSAPDIGAALARLLARHGRRPVEGAELRSMIGDGALNLLRAGFAATGAPLAPDAEGRVLAEYLDDLTAQPPRPESLYPGVVETLERLAGRGVRLGLCTNKPGRATGLILEGLGLARLFEAVAGGDALPHRKPDGRHLAHVLGRLGVEPAGSRGRAAMVGDNAHDVAVARACGVLSVAVSYGYPRMPVADLGADAVIDRFDDLPAALGRLAA